MIVCHCSYCNYIFPSQAINLDDATGGHIKFIGENTETCPNCGEQANILSGHYTINERGLTTLFSGPQFTHKMLRELKELSEIAYQQNFTPEQFTKSAYNINPVIGFLVKWLVPKDQVAFFALLAILIPSLITVYSKDEKPAVYNTTINIPTPKKDKVVTQKEKRNSNYTPPRKKKKRHKY